MLKIILSVALKILEAVFRKAANSSQKAEKGLKDKCKGGEAKRKKPRRGPQ
jgi:hypothetical protein